MTRVYKRLRASVLVQVEPAATFADLKLKMSAPTVGKTRKTLVYQLTVTNAGPTVATGVVVKTKLIAGVAPLVSAPGCVDTGHLVCAGRSLRSGGSIVFTIVIRAWKAGRYDNEASAGANEPDPELLNNGALSSTLVSR